MNIQYIENNKDSPYYIQTRNDLKALIKSRDFTNKNLILKCGAKWCGPCKYTTSELINILHQIKTNNLDVERTILESLRKKNKTIIIDIDVDEYDDISSYLKIKSLPTILTYYNGDLENIYNSVTKSEWIQTLHKLH